MTLYIDKITALLFWCMTTTSLDEATSPCTITEVRDADASLKNVPDDFFEKLGETHTKLHVLVGNATERSHTRNLITHLRTKPYPSGAFRRYSPAVLIASSELCFFEMASTLPFPKLVELGFLFCGTYTLNSSAKAPNARQPLTTLAKLESFANKMSPARGTNTARKALSLVIEGSASPRETKLTLLLCLPTRLGGYGFEQPRLNYQIDFNKQEALLFGKPYVVLDLYWKDYDLGIEYDGKENHTQDADVSRDRKKSSELEYKGITVLRVDKDQLDNPYQVYVLARKITQLMGKRFRKPTREQSAKRTQLFETIMR